MKLIRPKEGERWAWARRPALQEVGLPGGRAEDEAIVKHRVGEKVPERPDSLWKGEPGSRSNSVKSEMQRVPGKIPER